MDAIDLQSGVGMALDALYADRLTLLCGAGLSMASPSNLPSAAMLARKAKRKYDSTYGADRPPLPESIDAQAEYFFQRGELATSYLRTFIDHDDFAAEPNKGHFAAADLLLTGAIATAVSTNVDMLIETAGNMLFGHVGTGVSRDRVAALPPNVSPLLKIHGCWSNLTETVWAAGQVAADPIKTRLSECGDWLVNRLLDRDLVIVGYWTDWDYLNAALDSSLGAVNPSRVIVVDPCDTASFATKAPALYALGQRASVAFCHVKVSGDAFLDRLRVDFSRSFVRRVLYGGAALYAARAGMEPDTAWLEPSESSADVFWRIRRDLEGCAPNKPAKTREPADEPLLGLTLLQLQARGAITDGSYWSIGGRRVRVLRALNQPLHEVEAAFERETAPALAPEYVIAVGAEAMSLPPNIARGAGIGTIARGSSGRWLSRTDAVVEFGL